MAFYHRRLGAFRVKAALAYAFNYCNVVEWMDRHWHRQDIFWIANLLFFSNRRLSELFKIKMHDKIYVQVSLSEFVAVD